MNGLLIAIVVGAVASLLVFVIAGVYIARVQRSTDDDDPICKWRAGGGK